MWISRVCAFWALYLASCAQSTDLMNSNREIEIGWCRGAADCSNHGTCVNAVACQCFDGWVGADCSWGSKSHNAMPALIPDPKPTKQETRRENSNPPPILISDQTRVMNEQPGSPAVKAASFKVPSVVMEINSISNESPKITPSAESVFKRYIKQSGIGCGAGDMAGAVINSISLDECAAACDLDACVTFEYSNATQKCLIHYSPCQEVLSDGDLYDRIIPTSTHDFNFTCANGDQIAIALMRAVLPQDDLLTRLHMGTNGFGAAPRVCQDRVQNMFCRYNNEFREKPEHTAPTIPRQCASPEFPVLRGNGNIGSRCFANWKPPVAEQPLIRIGYIIMLRGNEVPALVRLLPAIDDPQNYYVIHVDAKGGETAMAMNETLAAIPSAMASRVRVISKVKVLWGGSSILRAYLICLRELLSMGSDWSYVINLSASDYPLYPQDQIRKFLTNFAAPQQLNFVDFGNTGSKSMSIPPWLTASGQSSGIASELSAEDIARKIHRLAGVVAECEEDGYVYATVSLRKLPAGIDWREGSFWHVLHRSFVQSMFASDTGIALSEYFDVLSNPDETYIQTALMNSEFCDRVCTMNLRFENWHPDVDPMHPLNMTMSDVDHAMRETAEKQTIRLFARKFAHADGETEVDDIRSYADLIRGSASIPSDFAIQ